MKYLYRVYTPITVLLAVRVISVPDRLKAFVIEEVVVPV